MSGAEDKAGKMPAPQIKILVGDGDPKNLQRIRKILAEEAYHVWTCAEAGELARIYETGNFDLLIMDIKIFAQLRRQQFPLELRESAVQVLEGHFPSSPTESFAPSSQREAAPPVIIMTDDADFPATIEAIKEGAIDFLEKPVRVKRLLVTIRNALQHRRKLLEMHRDQQELADLKELYERIINGIDYGIVVLDPQLRIESINRHLQRKQRQDATEAVGKHCHSFFYDRRAICDDCRIKEVFEGGKPAKYNIVHRTKWGTEFHLEVEAFPLFDQEGRVTRVVQLSKDVTERIRLQEQLREKKEYLENLLSHAPVGIFSTDQHGFIRAANPNFLQIFGARSLSDVMGLNVLEWEDFRKNGLSEQFRQVLETGQAITRDSMECKSSWGRQSDSQSVSANKTVCTFHCVPLRSLDNQIAGLIATVEDVSEKSKLEESFRKRIAELSIFKEIGELLQSTVDLQDIYAITLIGVTAGAALGFNRAFILRYDRSENTLIGEAAIGPSDAAEAGRIWSELYEKQLTLREIFNNYRQICSAGDQAAVGSADARVRAIVSQLRIPLTWESGLLPEVLFRNTPQNVTQASSGQFADQRLIAAAIGGDNYALVPLISRGKVEGIVIADNLISGKEIRAEDVNRLSIISNQAGAAIENSQLLKKLEEKVEALRLAYLDLKENRDLLLRAERLSAVGEVAAMVAHEIRNPLTSIGGFARAIKRDIEKANKSETNRRYLDIIIEEVKRLERIVTEILGFVRPVALHYAPMSIHEVIDQTFSMMSGEFDEKKIVVTRDFQHDMPPVWMDADQIRQVLLNLFRNALHAMKGEGMLSVITEARDHLARIYVADTGEGIRHDQVDKVFNAFFTTKTTGSGLGLTISQQIIKSHGGSIEVDSREGEGSTFIISLPLRSGETTHEEEDSRRGRRKKSAHPV